MNKKQSKGKNNKNDVKVMQGFTIIEVVLVLAIAGLIFLMVFVALPAMQRNQRDTSRKNAYGLVASAVASYQSNNNGKYPTGTGTSNELLTKKYIDENKFTDPSSGNTINITVYDANDGVPTTPPTEGYVYIVRHAKCSKTTSNTTNVKKEGSGFAVWGYLEAGEMYCQDN